MAHGATSPTISGVVKADVVALRDSLLAKGKSTSTVTKAISLIKAAYGAAIADDQFGLQVNPAAGVVVRGRASKRRPVWTVEQLSEALKALWPPAVTASSTGPVADDAVDRRDRAGASEVDYWLMLLLAYTGARLAEIASLRQVDLHLRPVPFLRLEEHDERGLKTEGSQRDVPLHPEIAEAFLAWARTRPGRLWSRAPAACGKRLRRFAEKVRGNCTPHGLRHLWRQRARAAGIPEEAADKIVGHAPANVGRRYGGYPIEALASEMGKITFPGLELPHRLGLPTEAAGETPRRSAPP